MAVGALEHEFALKKPCENCPFRREGAIRLRPGRMTGIINDMLENDHLGFSCHKTVHCGKGGDWVELTGEYIPSGNEMQCAGASIFLLKQGRPSVVMRVAMAFGKMDPDALIAEHGASVVDSAEEAEAVQRGIQ